MSSTTEFQNQDSELKKSKIWIVKNLKHSHFRSTEAKDFLKQIGCKDPLKILLSNPRHSFISDMLHLAIINSSDENCREQLKSNFTQEGNAIPLRALVVLYGAQTMGYSNAVLRMSSQTQAMVESQHLILGYATEFLYWSQLLHYSTSEESCSEFKGTKIGILVGDLFITQLYSMLSSLRSNKVTQYMSETLCSFAEIFYGKNNASKEDISANYGAPVLFANAFKSAALLSGRNEQYQRLAETFGRCFGEAYRTYDAIQIRQRLSKGVDALKLQLASEIETTMNLAKTFEVRHGYGPGPNSGMEGFKFILGVMGANSEKQNSEPLI